MKHFYLLTFYIAFAALFIFYGLTRLGSILIMPQWSIFIVIALLAVFGMSFALVCD